ncbi:hypothetical protein DES53_102566 [Roseimicrobium gellanilyticum]|uniref:Uncharacterized protein n=1 Tax=Roseimicrobium gellanilyticum TaxID=748857 RepID=A0A366HR92_9BACT|nr:hypothetical protein [Roseimicrobium gellanilyticum]RBP46180.1 hypothetical protein DES53_102566 [Roseimicrobium gellanilyticum]
MNTLTPSEPFGVVLLAVFLLTGIVHLCFAFAVWNDAGLMAKLHHRGTFLVGGFLWALATLVGGVFVAGVYWAIHHSTLRPQHPPEQG